MPYYVMLCMYAPTLMVALKRAKMGERVAASQRLTSRDTVTYCCLRTQDQGTHTHTKRTW